MRLHDAARLSVVRAPDDQPATLGGSADFQVVTPFGQVSLTVGVWTGDEWAVLPRSMRPPGAQRTENGCWVSLGR